VIESISRFLHHNLIVLLAVVLVPMKLIVLRLCNDNDAQKAAALSIPEDLVYVSLGLILGDFATSGGAFRKHFSNSQLVSMDLFVTVLVGVGVAIAIHVLAKFTNDQVKSWQAASQARFRAGLGDSLQQDLPLSPSDSNIRLIQTRHIALISILYLMQLGIAIRWLSWISGILANS
jgi:hypothetical protein